MSPLSPQMLELLHATRGLRQMLNREQDYQERQLHLELEAPPPPPPSSNEPRESSGVIVIDLA